MATIKLSRRALLDIDEIESYSIEKWGPLIAQEYLDSIEEALNLLSKNPQLLRDSLEFSESLCFYRVKQHFLVGAVIEDHIFVLTILHGAMDLPSRISELEPLLKQEADMLYNAVFKKP